MVTVFYKDLKLDIADSVYEPREDSFLLADNLKAKNALTSTSRSARGGEKVLEIGTGSGILAILAAKQGADVTATDINEEAVECARKNAIKNRAEGIEFLQGDLFAPVSGRKFDLIIFNPPYLPREEKYTDKKIDMSYNSSETLERFLKEYRNYLTEGGCALIVNSSISGVKAGGKIIAEKKLAFEKIFVAELIY